jgi:single-strand DNA-binding protein
MYLNSVTLTGFLGGDAEAKTLKNDGSLTVFSVATKNSWKDTETGEWVSRTEWHRCVAFGRVAEATAALKKGAHVYVQGQLQTREYVGNKGADKQRVTEIRVSSVLKVEILSQDDSVQAGEKIDDQ